MVVIRIKVLNGSEVGGCRMQRCSFVFFGVEDRQKRECLFCLPGEAGFLFTRLATVYKEFL